MSVPWMLLSACLVATVPPMPSVPPMDFSQLPPTDFADEELDLPYALAHFHRLANGVRDEQPDLGFIDLPVWRRAEDNRPYNARVMENHLALAYFYCTDRSWNPYFGHPAVRQRLEAVLEFWCGMQNDDGRFSEYGPQRWNLPATAFATKFMGQTLTLLNGGPPIDPALHRRVREANRRAIEAVLGSSEMYRSGQRFSNQYTNVWPGVLAHLALFPDDGLCELFVRRLRDSSRDFQSPAGYFYEADGPDWSYNLNTHHSNLHMAWHYARETDVADLFVAEVQSFYDWLSYNAVLEPDGSGFVLNRGVETRQRLPFLAPFEASLHASRISHAIPGTPLAELVEAARPFVPSREELQEQRDRVRSELENIWPELLPLTRSFSSYSPYQFLHRSHYQWYPTAEQKSEAISRLPYLARTSFLHQRMDGRHPVVYTYVRHPAYYAAWNSGTRITGQQRYGLGLVWTPQAGSFLQSQTGSNEAAWGTLADGQKQVYEAASFESRFFVDQQPVPPEPGCRDLQGTTLTTVYPLAERGEKWVAFTPEGLKVAVQHPGRFAECLPLLIRQTDHLDLGAGRTQIRRGDGAWTIDHGQAAEPRASETDLTCGPYSVVVLWLQAEQQLNYTMTWNSNLPTEPSD
jgi:hypothetical protein